MIGGKMNVLVVAVLLGQLSVSSHAQTPSVTMEQPKSPIKGVMLSGLVPGAGEFYANSPGRAKLFLASESVIWGAYLGFTYYGRRVRDDYRLFASSRAGSDLDTHSEDYYNALEEYYSSEDYNADVLREARSLYPGDSERQLAYYRENGYFGEQAWIWDDEPAWQRYRELRVKSRDAFQRALYMTGLAVLNRGLSMIDSFYLVRNLNKRSFGLQIVPEFDDQFTVSKFKIGVIAKFY
ncbi:hypothetical protein AMJ40_07420 [candidate division TA06 bacterium DG_26]|uniref:DUF5683 domain-containing protein n=1 Tax=candidate division TA06 bacterium DG_26 TaxID=1703771 RepID=A0A0S7WEC2_UNCT6|nr:MAG: hypothetical protein AMJ40_07420 [candidate division TA06 bacterium DG_26]